jgi:hypothetical protein
MGSFAVLVRVLLLLPLLASPLLAATPEGRLEAIRNLYLAAVDDSAAIDRALDEIGRVRSEGGLEKGSDMLVALRAYEGALITLRAKHGVWPPRRLGHLTAGLEILDEIVRDHPDHVEARYLRLMSCYYLPPILGRRQSVRADFAALARMLPARKGEFAPDLYQAIARFILEEGSPTAEQARALRMSLGQDES